MCRAKLNAVAARHPLAINRRVFVGERRICWRRRYIAIHRYNGRASFEIGEIQQGARAARASLCDARELLNTPPTCATDPLQLGQKTGICLAYKPGRAPVYTFTARQPLISN